MIRILKKTAAVITAAIFICIAGTILAFAASDYTGNDGFTSGKPLVEIGAAGEDEASSVKTEEETTPYIQETRSPEEQESIDALMESLEALYGENEHGDGSTGTLNVILRDETDEDSILLVLYDEYKNRREISIGKSTSYTCSVVLPAGRYNVIGAYPVSKDSDSKFYTNADKFELSQSGNYLIEIGVVERESVDIPETVPELKNTETESAAASELPVTELPKAGHKLLLVLALSALIGGIVLIICFRKSKR